MRRGIQYRFSRAQNFVNGKWIDSKGGVALERKSPLTNEVVGITP